jgi:hypothetical protein
LGNYIVDELVLNIFQIPNVNVDIMERTQLEKIFQEIQLSLAGGTDVDTMKELGKLHGVDALVVGSMTEIGDRLRINARLVQTETGRLFSAAAVTVPKTSNVSSLLNKKVTGRASSLGTSSAPSGGASQVVSEQAISGFPFTGRFVKTDVGQAGVPYVTSNGLGNGELEIDFKAPDGSYPHIVTLYAKVPDKLTVRFYIIGGGSNGEETSYVYSNIDSTDIDVKKFGWEKSGVNNIQLATGGDYVYWYLNGVHLDRDDPPGRETKISKIVISNIRGSEIYDLKAE